MSIHISDKTKTSGGRLHEFCHPPLLDQTTFESTTGSSDDDTGGTFPGNRHNKAGRNTRSATSAAASVVHPIAAKFTCVGN